MRRILMVLTAFLALLICATTVLAQRPESLQENMLLSAVKKYNEGNHDAARATLNAILEKDQTSDAAW